MREMKFRFWDTKENKWMVDGMTETNIYDFAFKSGMYWNFITKAEALERVIVEQYTGLKDKNGKEIYEGDDVDVSMSFEGGTLPHRGVIVYDNTFGAFGTKNDAGVTLLHNHCLHTLEIIGNIHQNPELLEKSK